MNHSASSRTDPHSSQGSGDFVKPVTTTYGYIEGSDYCFHTPKGLLRFTLKEQEMAEMSRILKLANGTRTVEEIAKDSLFTPEDFKGAIAELFKNKIIWPSNKLGEWFHETTKEECIFRSDFDADLFSTLHGLKRTGEELKKKTPLNELLHSRKSIRDFAPSPLEEEQVKELVDAMYYLDGVPTVASGGSIYPLKLHVLNLREARSRELFASFQDATIPKKASHAIVVCGDLNMHPTKYANRGYRYTLMEAGSVVQNAYLKAAEMGIGVFAYGGFNDTELQKITGDTPLIVLFVGNKASEAVETPAVYTLNAIFNTYKPLIKTHLVTELKFKDEAVGGYASIVRTETGGGFGFSFNKSEASLKAMCEGLERYFCGKFFYDVDDGQKWVRGRRLLDQKETLVLADKIFYPLPPEVLGYKRTHKANSNGVAAHTTQDKAIENGLLELIERDAFAMAWFGKAPITEVKMLPRDLKLAVEKWEKRGYDVRFFDLTRDSVPVILCTFSSKIHFPHFAVGASAAYKLADALEKAFNEAQATTVTWSAQEEKIVEEKEIIKPLDHGMFYASLERYKVPLKELNIVDGENDGHRDFTFQELVEKFDPISISLEEQDGFHVVRVISDKLCPIYFGHGYSVQGHPRFADLDIGFKNDRIHFFP